MQQAPSWEANSSWGRQELPQILWNPMAHCHVHKSQLLVPVLSHMNPMYTLWSYFFKIWFNIGFLSVPKSLGLHTEMLYQFLISSIHATCPTFSFSVCPKHIHTNCITSGLHCILKCKDYIAFLCFVIPHKYSCVCMVVYLHYRPAVTYKRVSCVTAVCCVYV